MKYGQWLEEWLSTTVKPLKKLRTYQKYNYIATRLLMPELGECEIKSLTSSVLQNFVANLSQKYAANTVNGIITVLKSSLQRAEIMGLVQRQYSDSIQYPKHEEKPVECFTLTEQRQIEQYVIESQKPKLYGILICLYMGLRVGELIALEWGDIDIRKALMTISKTCHDSWEEGKYKKIVDAPKTRTSRRVIPIPKTVLPYIKEMKSQSKSTYVVSGKDGKDISIRSYQRTFELVLRRLEIPHKGFHSLRHTFATRAIECGMDVKTLSEILGHNNPAITLKRYVHSLMEHKCAMMNKLGKNLQ